jgi:type I restriction enzyme M protein
MNSREAPSQGHPVRGSKQLLKEFNLHTIIRLPNGVFAPYTGIPSNLLFFDRNGPTKDVWFYEHPLPEGRKNYTKTQPIQFEEFAPLIQWWGKRKANDRAWKVPAKEILANGCNLDRKNPSAKDDITHLPPAELAASILEKEKRIAEIMGNIRKLLAK